MQIELWMVVSATLVVDLCMIQMALAPDPFQGKPRSQAVSDMEQRRIDRWNRLYGLLTIEEEASLAAAVAPENPVEVVNIEDDELSTAPIHNIWIDKIVELWKAKVGSHTTCLQRLNMVLRKYSGDEYVLFQVLRHMEGDITSIDEEMAADIPPLADEPDETDTSPLDRTEE